MGAKVIEYVEASQIYATNYIRNSKAIAVLWAIFTICYSIIVIVSFVTPDWIGDLESETGGRIGLWKICERNEMSDVCIGKLEDILEMPSMSFQIATIFAGIAVATSLLTILCLVLMIFLKSTTVFHLCGWMQILSAISMIVACVSFPFGWNSDEFRKICSPEANRFEVGLCSIRWAYALAIIACIDGCILATLAFILATRHIRLQPDPTYSRNIGTVNNAYITDVHSIAGSRKSLNLKPVLLVTPPHIQTADDSISQFSSRNGTNHRFHNPMHHHHHHHQQFQL
ncbi:LHFPL tetraspan subfamily member 5 protein [Chironomus tepperi]|uniref:LHFPL tetraspan subfamily member 5 protein n=1 Tax=Chironomus tepperi TaxID=113505 RepID=UPI00391F92F2